MTDTNSARAVLEGRIADVEENLRNLIEEATAFSGSNDEDRTADRIAQQQEELEALKRQRDGLA